LLPEIAPRINLPTVTHEANPEEEEDNIATFGAMMPKISLKKILFIAASENLDNQYARL